LKLDENITARLFALLYGLFYARVLIYTKKDQFLAFVLNRISPPGDFCTSSFNQSPVCHTFPVAVISKSLSICVTARCMPRMHDIPHIRCLGTHNIEQPPVGATGGACSKASKCNFTSCQLSSDKIPSDGRLHHDSPRFQKPRVVRAPVLQKSDVSQSQDECQQQDTKTGGMFREAARLPYSSSTLMKQRISPPPSVKQTGAIPKRLPCKTPPPTFYESDCASSAPELDLLAKNQEISDAKSGPSASENTSPRVIITQKIPTQVYYGKEKINWILKNVINNGSSTDSDSSSPDIDRYLNKTLANRLEPLSPAEMEDYLETLCTVPSRGKKACDNQNSGELNYAYNNHKCEMKQLPSLENLTAVNHKKVKDVMASDVNASFSSLILNGKKDASPEQRYSSSRSKAYKQMAATKSHEAKPSPCSLKCQEKSLSLQEPTNGSQLSQSESLSLPHHHNDDPVRFTLAEDDLDVSKKEYSDHGHTNSSSMLAATDSSCLATDTSPQQQDHFQNGSSNLDITEVDPEQNVTNDMSQKYLSSQSSSSKKNAFHKSISCPGSENNKGFTLPVQTVSIKANSLLKSVMRKELSQNDQVPQHWFIFICYMLSRIN